MQRVTGSTDVGLGDVVDSDLSLFWKHQRDHIANHMAAFTAKDPFDVEALTRKWTRIRSDASITRKTILLQKAATGHIGSFTSDGQLEVTYWLARQA